MCCMEKLCLKYVWIKSGAIMQGRNSSKDLKRCHLLRKFSGFFDKKYKYYRKNIYYMMAATAGKVGQVL